MCSLILPHNEFKVHETVRVSDILKEAVLNDNTSAKNNVWNEGFVYKGFSSVF